MTCNLTDIARLKEDLMGEPILQACQLWPVLLIDVHDRLELLLRGRDEPQLALPDLCEALNDPLEIPNPWQLAGRVLPHLVHYEYDVAPLSTRFGKLRSEEHTSELQSLA